MNIIHTYTFTYINFLYKKKLSIFIKKLYIYKKDRIMYLIFYLFFYFIFKCF